jgi:vancomycin resistance protein YoaR
MELNGYRITLSIRIILIKFIICAVGVLCGFAIGIRNEIKKWDKLIYPGIKIENLIISGNTKEEAAKLLTANVIEPMMKSNISLKLDDKTYTLEISKLVKGYGIDSILDEAFSIGKALEAYRKYSIIRRGVSADYKLTYEFNEEYIKEYIRALESEITKDPVNANVHIGQDNSIVFTESSEGFRLKPKELEEDIKNLIMNGSYQDNVIMIPVEKISPDITADMLSSIDTMVSFFSTDYSTSSYERSRNVELAAELINGKLLMPGDTFSFNDSVGERTMERGFMSAPIVVGNKVESGLGGGICQVSSTLYNVILQTGLSSFERVNHTLPSSYVPLGLDATVDWNTIDFKFTNTYKYPMLLNAYTADKNLYINIYSNSSLKDKKYVISSSVYERIKASSQIINEPNMAEGEVAVIRNANDGFKVKVTRDTYENGILLNSEVISNDYYMPVEGLIKKRIK